ncbi:MAG: hypothetical protein PHW34_09075 [Hespellia sp.]|nr:hypothetical protein [Hespellia sp.]
MNDLKQELSKPRSFRINDETANKFKQIADELQENQQGAFARLIEAYEMQQVKINLGEDKKVLEKYEEHMSSINRLVTNLLEEKINIEEKVRGDYEVLLRSKDTTIQELQGSNTVMEQIKESSQKRSAELKDENARLTAQISELEKKLEEQQMDFKEKLSDKDRLNQTLTDSCAELKDKNQKMKSTVEQTDQIMKEKEKVEQEVVLLQKQIEEMSNEAVKLQQTTELERQKLVMDLQTEHDTERKTMEEAHQKQLEELRLKQQESVRSIEMSELTGEKKLLEAEQKHAKEVEELKAKMQEAIDKYQQKYFTLLERMEGGVAK